MKLIMRYLKGTINEWLVFDRDKAATCNVVGSLILIVMVILAEGDLFLAMS